MKGVLLLLLTLVLLAGCSTTPYVPPAECDGQMSVILSTIPDPAALSKGLLLVNLAALEAVKGYSPDDALGMLDQIDEMLDQTEMSYAELVAYVLNKIQVANALAGASVFVAGEDIELLNTPLPISRCDLSLIRIHLAKQRTMVTLYAAGK